MNDLVTISLNDLRFFAYHGLYPEERKTGNEFIVHLNVGYRPISGTITDIKESVNYVSLFDLVKKQMEQPRDLLETVAMETVEKIHTLYPFIANAEIVIVKLTAPISPIEGNVSVRYSREFI